MAIIRSILFWLSIYFLVILLVVGFFLSSPFIRRKNFADECAKLWARAVLFSLKIICNIDHKIIGLENMPQGACIMACKHQSMWETVIFHLVCKHPAYIYKKELLKIPFYGWYVKRMSGVKVDRSGGASALKELIKQTKFFLNKGNSIIIFPQGTRLHIDASTKQHPYQVGIAALYLACGVPVVPVALNSGALWSKSMLIKKSGTITMEILKPI